MLRNQRNTLERTPALAAGMDEAQIRDLLLVNLNAKFQGTAAGEVFNGAGKTDILIDSGPASVLVLCLQDRLGECDRMVVAAHLSPSWSERLLG